jgi:hypothetical protein
MLSPSTLSCIETVVRVAWFTHNLPYKWNRSLCALEVITSPGYLRLFYLVSLYSFSHAIYACIRLVQQARYRTDSRIDDVVTQAPLLLGLALSATLQLNTLLRRVDIAAFVTAYIQHEQNLSSNHCIYPKRIP